MDKWILLLELGLLLSEVVEATAMGFRLPVLGAEHIAALARLLHETHFLLAIPALVRVRLHSRLSLGAKTYLDLTFIWHFCFCLFEGLRWRRNLLW